MASSGEGSLARILNREILKNVMWQPPGESNEGVGEVINIASGEEITIKDLILKIHNLSDSKSKLKIGALPYRPTEIWRMSGDYTKAKKLLGWSPKVPLEEGLRRSIEWYRKFLDIFEGKESKLLNLNE